MSEHYYYVMIYLDKYEIVLKVGLTNCLYTLLQSEVRKWQSSQSGQSDKN